MSSQIGQWLHLMVKNLAMPNWMPILASEWTSSTLFFSMTNFKCLIDVNGIALIGTNLARGGGIQTVKPLPVPKIMYSH